MMLLSEKLVIKLPLTRSGIVAARSLLARDVKVCMTVSR
jgi:transaldolase